MNIQILPKPKTRHGPCKNNCTHNIHRAIRRIAIAKCRYCKFSIGFGVRFFHDENGVYVHVDCIEDYVPNG